MTDLCWACMSPFTMSSSESGSYSSFFEAMITPSWKRWVKICGERIPESSVWTWNTQPLWRMLWLYPRTGDRDLGTAVHYLSTRDTLKTHPGPDTETGLFRL